MAISNDKLLNAVKLDLPGEYKDKIPTATKTNLLDIADIMIEYPTLKNAFLTRLINKVGKTIIDKKVYQNRFKEFKKEKLAYGTSIEYIFTDLIKAKDFSENFGSNAAESLLSSVNNNNVGVQYVSKNYEVKWKETISDVIFRQAFTTENGLYNLIDTKVQAVINSTEYNEELAINGVLNLMPMVEEVVTGYADTQAGYKAFLKKVKELSLKLPICSNKYNVQGVHTWTNLEDMIIFMTPELQAAIDVEVLASLMHIEKAEIGNRIRTVEKFMKPKSASDKTLIEDTNCIAKIIDKEALQLRPTYEGQKVFENGDQLITNMFFHRQGMCYGLSFKNTISLVKQAAPGA